MLSSSMSSPASLAGKDSSRRIVCELTRSTTRTRSRPPDHVRLETTSKFRKAVMRKVLLPLLALLFFLTSCAHAPKGGEFRQTRDSAYKIEVTMTVDLAPYKEFLAKK